MTRPKRERSVTRSVLRDANLLPAERAWLHTPGARTPDGARGSLIEEAAEPLEDDFDGLGDSTQRVIDWESIDKRYLDGHIGIHFHLGIRTGDDQANPHEFCAYLQRKPGDRSASEPAFDMTVLTPMRQPIFHASRRDGSRNHKTMLVVVADVAQKSERMEVHSLPTFVRLEPLNDCPMGVRNILKHVGGSVPEVGRPPHDRELGSTLGRIYAPEPKRAASQPRSSRATLHRYQSRRPVQTSCSRFSPRSSPPIPSPPQLRWHGLPLRKAASC